MVRTCRSALFSAALLSWTAALTASPTGDAPSLERAPLPGSDGQTYVGIVDFGGIDLPELAGAEVSGVSDLDLLGLDLVAVDMYLKIDGIEGESTAARGHDDWIVVHSFSWGESRPSSSATGAARRRSSATFSDVSVVKTVDAASPKLYLACAQGKHFPAAVLEFRRAGSQQAYFTIRMQNVLVSSVSVSNSEGQDVPVEEVTLTYGKIQWEYAPQDGTVPGGNVQAGWDLEAGRGG